MAEEKPHANDRFHCDVCQKNIHNNDKETHLNGNKHKFRVRQANNIQKNQEECAFDCPICETKFTDEGFYTVHMGSKTHKRNLRRRKRLIESRNRDEQSLADNVSVRFSGMPKARRSRPKMAEEVLDLDTLTDIPEYKYQREKYHPSAMKIDDGQIRSYMHSVVAYWALSLAVDATVEDFKISVNNKDWKIFGDVIIEIYFGGSEAATTYVIKFRQISNINKTIDSITTGKFNFKKLILQLVDLNTVQDLSSFKFIVFTTAAISDQVGKTVSLKPANKIIAEPGGDGISKPSEEDIIIKMRALSNKRKDPINTTGESENIYLIASDSSTYSLPKVFFYTRQKKSKTFGSSIDGLIFERFDKCKEVHREFIKFVECWGDGLLGGSYKLTKEDVALKIGDILLCDYRINPDTFPMYNNQNFSLWNYAINSVDVTVLKRNPSIIAKVCQPINKRVEREFGLQIDTTSKTVRLTQKEIQNRCSPILKMLLFEETLGNIEDDIPLDTTYVMLWKAGLIPLLLRAEDTKTQDFILKVIEFIKSLNVTRRYLLKTSDTGVKNSVKPYKTLKFFITLDDLKDLPAAIFDYVKINVTETFSVSVKAIQECDQFFQKSITSNEFFDLCLGKYSFKPVDDFLRTHQTEESKLILDDGLMIKLRDEIASKSTAFNKTKDDSKCWLRDIDPNIF